jgi:hypothetical protein
MMDDGNDDNNEHNAANFLTPDEFLKIGLRLVGYTKRRIRRSKKRSNVERFLGHFGSIPCICASIWEDLQTTQVEEARVPKERLNVQHFLMAMHHLKRYPTEVEREALFDISFKWGREKVWYYVEKVQALKAQKIVWPADNFGDDIWCLTVDGTHCWIQEPQHPTWSKDSSWYSHKYNKAGVNYELGLSISENRLVWMNGPFKAGKNDVSTFTNKGLKQKLQAIGPGKKAIGDSGYTGHSQHISTPNSHDSRNVKKFKGRALLRQEKFNGMTKNFDCLSGRFRHSADRFENCFEAVCVICQYQLENNRPLFDVLIDDVMD